MTHVLALEAGPEGACEKATHRHRTAVRKAERVGLTVRRATTAADWEAYFSIYESTLARWGRNASSRYDGSLFEILRRRGEPGVTLWLVELKNGTIVSGAVTLSAPHHVVGWHMATLAEHFQLRPANLLVHEMARDACERSLDWLDLNPSGGHEGVRVFKERCGGQAVACPVIVRDAPWARAVASCSIVAAKLRQATVRGKREPDGASEASRD